MSEVPNNNELLYQASLIQEQQQTLIKLIDAWLDDARKVAVREARISSKGTAQKVLSAKADISGWIAFLDAKLRSISLANGNVNVSLNTDVLLELVQRETGYDVQAG